MHLFVCYLVKKCWQYVSLKFPIFVNSPKKHDLIDIAEIRIHILKLFTYNLFYILWETILICSAQNNFWIYNAFVLSAHKLHYAISFHDKNRFEN